MPAPPHARALDDPRKVALAQALYADRTHSIADVCRALGVSRSTLYRYVSGRRTPSANDSAAPPGR